MAGCLQGFRARYWVCLLQADFSIFPWIMACNARNALNTPKFNEIIWKIHGKYSLQKQPGFHIFFASLIWSKSFEFSWFLLDFSRKLKMLESLKSAWNALNNWILLLCRQTDETFERFGRFCGRLEMLSIESLIYWLVFIGFVHNLLELLLGASGKSTTFLTLKTVRAWCKISAEKLD